MGNSVHWKSHNVIDRKVTAQSMDARGIVAGCSLAGRGDAMSMACRLRRDGKDDLEIEQKGRVDVHDAEIKSGVVKIEST